VRTVLQKNIPIRAQSFQNQEEKKGETTTNFPKKRLFKEHAQMGIDLRDAWVRDKKRKKTVRDRGKKVCRSAHSNSRKKALYLPRMETPKWTVPTIKIGGRLTGLVREKRVMENFWGPNAGTSEKGQACLSERSHE